MNPSVVLRDHRCGDWLHFHNAVAAFVAYDSDEVVPCLRAIETEVAARGLFAAGFVAYEAAPAFDRALRVHPLAARMPLLWFGLFETCERRDTLMPARGDIDLATWQASIGEAAYERAIDVIRAHIARGETYQVNFSYRLRSRFDGDPWALFHRMQQAQEAPCAAFIATDDFAICSASPELFFRLDGDQVLARPMKGTSARGRTGREDEEQAAALQRSAKDRAENIMIVDMVRNDLGHIAETGTVHAPELFTVERYPTLWQMTSTVTARTQASVTDIVAALFPCASVTGAPKVRTMQIIRQLETTPRGIYTGCIGFIAPDGDTPRAQFNVAIRTVVIDRRSGEAEYGVGSGIVWDSQPAAEWLETHIKARVLTAPPPSFQLLESLLWQPGAGYALLERHLARAASSAAYFGFVFDETRVRAELDRLGQTLPPVPSKARLLIGRDGNITCEAAALDSIPNPVRLGLARAPIASSDAFLFHKTTQRHAYARALASRPDCDDVLLWNESGELTESTRANLALKLDGQWFTPPISSGLLAGTLRSAWLDAGLLRERVLTLADLERAEDLYLFNSVRGRIPVVWISEINAAPAQNPQ